MYVNILWIPMTCIVAKCHFMGIYELPKSATTVTIMRICHSWGGDTWSGRWQIGGKTCGRLEIGGKQMLEVEMGKQCGGGRLGYKMW